MFNMKFGKHSLDEIDEGSVMLSSTRIPSIFGLLLEVILVDMGEPDAHQIVESRIPGSPARANAAAAWIPSRRDEDGRSSLSGLRAIKTTCPNPKHHSLQFGDGFRAFANLRHSRCGLVTRRLPSR